MFVRTLMQYPDGYLEAQAASQDQSSEEEGGKQKGKRGKKRKNAGQRNGAVPEDRVRSATLKCPYLVFCYNYTRETSYIIAK